jgi:hypothetical protein
VVGNYAARYYKFAMVSVRQLQQLIVNSLHIEVPAFEKQVEAALKATGANRRDVLDLITEFTAKQSNAISTEYKNLFPLLLTKYRDGMTFYDLTSAYVSINRNFYPRWWLQAVGYFSVAPNSDPSAILFSPSPSASSGATVPSGMVLLLTALLCGFLGYRLGKSTTASTPYHYTHVSSTAGGRYHPYSAINGVDEADKEMIPFSRSFVSSNI